MTITPSVVRREVPITYPQGFPQMLKMSDHEFVAEMRLLAAAKFYELGRLTTGKAGQLAEASRAKEIGTG